MFGLTDEAAGTFQSSDAFWKATCWKADTPAADSPDDHAPAFQSST